ncbi:MAG: type II toxin-antitoxin system HicB family antitoxin [Candidatus Wallbacteria bacterium]|nr:type II toxin-antitoxin system HicB family antitoxin [Candidatus Wallbacteria bacterium]
MHKFLVVIEKADGNFSAYSPDLPGCIATGGTKEDAEKNMFEAIKFHIEGLREDNLPIPENGSSAEYVVIAA